MLISIFSWWNHYFSTPNPIKSPFFHGKITHLNPIFPFLNHPVCSGASGSGGKRGAAVGAAEVSSSAGVVRAWPNSTQLGDFSAGYPR